MKLRRLNPAGIEKFTEYLDLLESEPKRLMPEILEDSNYSETLEKNITIVGQKFGSRYSAAEYLYNIFSNAGLVDIDRDIGIWAWLAFFYFDELCPSNRFGEREPRERPAYIPEPQNFQRYYRHLLLGPYLIYRANVDAPKRAMALLCKPLPIIDDIVAQIASRQELVSNAALVGLATHLYFDPESEQPKKGAGGKGGGSPRRLATVISQFDVTWDLYAMSLKEFCEVLPKEFEKFLSI